MKVLGSLLGLWGGMVWGIVLLLLWGRQATPQPAYIAFLGAERNSLTYHLYLQPMDGTPAKQLSPLPLEKQTLRWSPDGRWLLFASKPTRGTSIVYRLSPHARSPQALMTQPGYYTAPAWSPDGEWIAFAAHVGGDNFQLYRMRPDGSERQSLGFGFHSGMSWSPDSQWLVFNVRVNYSGDFEIYRAHMADSKVIRLTSGSGVNVSPAWSPNGEWIAFASSRDSKMEIYRMRPNGTGQERLTALPGENGYPLWSPDGETLLFTSTMPEGSRLFIMQADGSQPYPITASYGHIASAVWSPVVTISWQPLTLLLVGLVPIVVLLFLGQHAIYY